MRGSCLYLLRGRLRVDPVGRGNVCLDFVQIIAQHVEERRIARMLIDETGCTVGLAVHGRVVLVEVRALDFIKQVFIETGIPLDSTYTGKAYFGMSNYLYSNSIDDKKVLFLHTGGTPLFFDDIMKMYKDF